MLSLRPVRRARSDVPENDLKPLDRIHSGWLVALGKDGYFGIENADEKIHDPGCGIGLAARDDSPNPKDAYGRTFAEHWVVPPGRQVTGSLATKSLKLPYDTTIHKEAEAGGHPIGLRCRPTQSGAAAADRSQIPFC